MVESHRQQHRHGEQQSIDDRARKLFGLLVEEYLERGNPIGSKHLAEHTEITVSSATVRNIMADLEARGLVSSPHTSAGKIPTQRGLRFFVDSLILVQPLDTAAETYVRNVLTPDLSPTELVSSAAQLLSQMSSLAGVVSTPRPEQVALRQVEFLKLSGARVLAILVVNEREVQNRVVETEREYDETELHQAANLINQEFAGRSLQQIRTGVLDSMRADKEQMNSLMQTALDVASKTFAADEDEPDHDVIVTGERNLVSLLSSSEEVQQLLDAFTSKSAIVHLLDRCLGSEGVQLYIGEESGYDPLGDFSLISTQYEVEGEVAGTMGVIGPTRMSYDKVIPLVDITAHLLGSALEHTHS